MPENIFPTEDSEKRFFLILSGALTFFLVTSFVLGNRIERGDFSTPTHLVENQFPEVELEAKSAYVYDLRTGKELFAQDPDRRLPLASITKLMSALVALDLSPSYGTVTVTGSALAVYGDSGLKNGEKWSLGNLLDFSLLTSSNDGIHAVALSLASLEKTLVTDEEIINSFVVEMNAKASKLGLKNTYFWNETGLDESLAKGGAYGSARDISTLVGYILKNNPSALEATKESETTINSSDSVHEARNTNSVANQIPGLLASKTGFTDIAGGNLVFIFDPELGRPIVVTILGSSGEGRFVDALKLVDATLEYIGGEVKLKSEN